MTSVVSGKGKKVLTMRDITCEKCRSSICVENAEDNADGMCRNCELCVENGFKYQVKNPKNCEMWEDVDDG